MTKYIKLLIRIPILILVFPFLIFPLIGWAFEGDSGFIKEYFELWKP